MRDNSFNLNNLWYFNQFRYNFLYLVNSRNSCWSFDNFLYNLLCGDNLLYFRFNCHYLLHNGGDLFDNLRHIRHNLFNFFNSLINNNFLYHFFNVLNFYIFLFCLHNFLYKLRYLNNFFKNLSYWNNFFNSDFYRNSNLFWNNQYFLDLNRK